jgi:hypothetical protein
VKIELTPDYTISGWNMQGGFFIEEDEIGFEIESNLFIYLVIVKIT